MDGENSSASAYPDVDAFMRDAVGARALASAFELGLVDRMASVEACALEELGSKAGIDRRGIELLLSMLHAGGIAEPAGGRWRLSRRFREALRFRDLIEAKLEFSSLVARDFNERFGTLLTDPQAFFERSRLFELFSYDRCFDSTPENVANTARWMRFTTALTRYEAGPCLDAHDFSRYRRMLDVGGNSGEFVLQACRANPALRATVLDLPVVCDLGEKHVSREPEAQRIDFSRVAPSGGAFPGGFDLVSYKSMLHDWPDDRVEAFVSRAYDALVPGGTLLIFERLPIAIGAQPLEWSQVPLLLFFRAYREPGAYAAVLERAGFAAVQARTLQLDMPFMLIAATKPGAQ